MRTLLRFGCLAGFLLCLGQLTNAGRSAQAEEAPASVKVGVFSVDVSPTAGDPLMYDPCKGVQLPLLCRGIVLTGADKPVVLCAVDWIGIGNGGHDEWREELAKAAGTDADHVTVHTLHQHDAPVADFEVGTLLQKHGVTEHPFDNNMGRDALSKAAAAVKYAAEHLVPVTHIGLGTGEVEKVASNRRILGEDGKVRAVRYTSCRDPKLRAEPEGIIDNQLRSISFWQNDKPVIVLTYYATHPQSYYRTGLANPDFPGIARQIRDQAFIGTAHVDDKGQPTGFRHVHFNGAGGNIGAGKYNDGAPENRLILAERLAAGMERAWQNTKKFPVEPADIAWTTAKVVLPPAEHLQEAALKTTLENADATPADRVVAARNLVFLKRCQRGHQITIGCLSLGKARVLHLPGELAVEYQLAAQQMAPKNFVAMAAYGDYGSGYICQAIHYKQGGYEASARASRVSPAVENVLMTAMRKLLQVKAEP